MAKKKRRIIISIIALLLVISGCVFVKIYYDVENSANETYFKAKRTKLDVDRDKKISMKDGNSFSILLLGVDTGALGRNYKGRSDSMMIATVNSNNKKTTLVSLERDTYAPIIGNDQSDKINHAYAYGGAGMAMDTVSSLLSIPIDHYIVINMKGIQKLIDAVGGVDVDNKFDFSYTQSGKTDTYEAGNIHIEGQKALGYLRMRYDDPDGDYGRQRRQREVLQAISKKALSLDGVRQYKSVLDAMSRNILTDLTFDEMKNMLSYRSAFENIQTQQLKGRGFVKNGVSYQKVSNKDLELLYKQLAKELEINN